MTTEKRKAQQREASRNNRKAKQASGWKRLWINPKILQRVRDLIKELEGYKD